MLLVKDIATKLSFKYFDIARYETILVDFSLGNLLHVFMGNRLLLKSL
jgi:hypothetical protein